MPNMCTMVRHIVHQATDRRVKTASQAEAEIKNSILSLGIPFIAAHVEFLPNKGRWAEAAALVNGQPVYVELLTRAR